jgi:hypothetical protein
LSSRDEPVRTERKTTMSNNRVPASFASLAFAAVIAASPCLVAHPIAARTATAGAAGLYRVELRLPDPGAVVAEEEIGRAHV